MLKVNFDEFINSEIALLTEKINDDKHSANDEVSAGKLLFFAALREFIDGQPSNRSRGLVGAVNDVLQKLELVEPKATLPSIILKLA